jgi:pimeloyl-ACP methyl ester carboxylesterase
MLTRILQRAAVLLLIAVPATAAVYPRANIKPFVVDNQDYRLQCQLNQIPGSSTVVLFLHGTGVQDRWETAPGNLTLDGAPASLFKPISDELNRRGISTIVYDKRGFRERGSFAETEALTSSTFENLEGDARRVLTYAQALPGVQKICMVGVAEGAVIASELSFERKDDSPLSSLVLLGVLASNLKDNLRYQAIGGVIRRIFQVADKDGDLKLEAREIPSNLSLAALDTDKKGFLLPADFERELEPKWVKFERSIEDARPETLIDGHPAAWYQQMFARKSLDRRAEEFNLPVYLVHGELDLDEPYVANAVSLYDHITAAKGEVRLRSFPTYGHCFSPNKDGVPTYGPIRSDAVRAIVQDVIDGTDPHGNK